MSYATAEDLAEALEIRVTPDNQQLLDDCLAAAATEIDLFLVDCDVADPSAMPIIGRTNVNRAVEWYKAPATYNGGVGTTETGTMAAPTSGFDRHAAVLTPLRTRWGLA
jgi:hypothetical protein